MIVWTSIPEHRRGMPCADCKHDPVFYNKEKDLVVCYRHACTRIPGRERTLRVDFVGTGDL